MLGRDLPITGYWTLTFKIEYPSSHFFCELMWKLLIYSDIAYVTAVAVVPTIADTLLLQAASCCRHHDVTVIFTAEIFHAAANVLTAVGTPSCVPDFLLLLAFPFWLPLLLLNMGSCCCCVPTLAGVSSCWHLCCRLWTPQLQAALQLLAVLL